ncbi:MAG: hypothetical protein QM500_02540, partial [Methylococcales bacterium]
VHAHLSGKDDFGLIDTDKLLDIVGDWESYLLEAQSILLKRLKIMSELGDHLGTKALLNWLD